MLWGDQQVTPASVTTPGGDDDAPTTITADVSGALGKHRVRLRVDGVDSIPIKVVNGGFEFDDDQSVEVQP